MKISNDVFYKIISYYDKNALDSLYREESACTIIFRILPELCQQTIMRIINIDNLVNFKIQDIKSEWPDLIDSSDTDYKKCIGILNLCRIIVDPNILLINEDFKTNLLKVIKLGISPKPNLITKKKTKGWTKSFKNGLEALEKYLLNIMDLDGLIVYSDSEDKRSKQIRLLLDSGLIKSDREKNYYQLTSIALQGMLDNRLTQIRLLMIRYINVLAERYKKESGKLLKFINFLFSISTLEVGAPYKLDYYESEFQEHVEDVFRNFGIVNVKRSRKKNSKSFYVTPLMKCLFEDMGNIFENQENYKYLIVESNFKIYAYTDSLLEKKIIDFLFETEYIFPGLIVGHITRSSIRKVLKRSVGHQKILQFMSMHAHAQSDYKTVINKVTYNVPENVAQQILIWEEEKNAVLSENVIYLFEFGPNDYERYLEAFKREGVKILWENREKSILILPRTSKTHEIIKRLS